MRKIGKAVSYSSQNEMPIYALSGLGTDERIFSRLSWSQPMHYLPWLTPYRRETLQSYAARMAAGIPGDQPVIILGLSFGGIVAQEIARIRPVKQLLLLSTIKSAAEKPLAFRLMRYLPLYQLSRGSWRIRTLPYWAPRFGVRDQEEIALLQRMFGEFSDDYRMWAVKQLTHWDSAAPPSVPCTHLHGTADHVFPARYLQGAKLVSGANHFMVYQEPERVSEWIRDSVRL